MSDTLKKISEQGQSLWYDNIERSLIEDGELTRLVNEDHIVGVTSNPSIFEKAISGSTAYDAQIAEIVANNPTIPIKDLYEALAIEDIQDAAEVLQPVYERSNGADGYVSLEVSPDLANDTEGTIAEAKRLFETVARPNLMIKIPATSAGIPAITRAPFSALSIALSTSSFEAFGTVPMISLSYGFITSKFSCPENHSPSISILYSFVILYLSDVRNE